MGEASHTPPPSDQDLRGAHLVVLRGSVWGERVADRIRSRGGDARVLPLLEIEIPESERLRREVDAWARGEYDWLLITSMNTVRAIEKACGRLSVADPMGDAAGISGAPRVAAVGPGTASAASEIGLAVSLVPDEKFDTEGLLAAIGATLGERRNRFLFPSSNLTDDRMQAALQQAGHQVVRLTAYETREVAGPADLDEQLSEHPLTVVLITSGSAARALHRQLPTLPEGVRIAAIGGSSARTLAELGIRTDVVATRQTIDGLLDAIAHELLPTLTQKDDA